MSPARTRAEAVTQDMKVISTWEHGKNVMVKLMGCSSSDWYDKQFGICEIQVPYNKAADFLPGTIVQVTITNKKKAEAEEERDRDTPAVLRSIVGTGSAGPG